MDKLLFPRYNQAGKFKVLDNWRKTWYQPRGSPELLRVVARLGWDTTLLLVSFLFGGRSYFEYIS